MWGGLASRHEVETMVEVLFEGELLADYHQFYLHDEAFPELPDDYSDESLARRLMAGSHGVIVHAARNMTVPVRVELHAAEPAADLAEFQHVVEAGFSSPSGRLVLAGLTDYVVTAARLTTPAGSLCVMACFAGLDTVDQFGLEGQDRYVLRLWRGPAATGVRVLKAWRPA